MLTIPEDVKAAFMIDRSEKRIRVHFPNGEHADLTNSDIVSESVRFTESICSEDDLQFGLCEATELDFSTINCGNIKGCEIEVYEEVYYDKTVRDAIIENTYTVLSEETTIRHGSTPSAIPANIGTVNNLYITYSCEDDLPLTISAAGVSYNVDAARSKHTINLDLNAPVPINQISIFNRGISDLTLTRVDARLISYDEYTEPDWYAVPFGRFTVDSCKRNANGFKRDVVAFSQYLNVFNTISPFEKAKLESRQPTKSDYVINPVCFALANISQSVDLDFDDFGLFDGISTLKGDLIETSSTVNYSPDQLNPYSVKIKVFYKTFDLSSYKNWPHLIAYKTGERITSEKEIVDTFIEAATRYAGYSPFYHTYFKCAPYGYIFKMKSPYEGTSNDIYGETPNLMDSGFIIPKFTGDGNHDYQIRFPYRIELTINRKRSVEVVYSQAFDICDPDEIDLCFCYVNLPSRPVYIPAVDYAMSRVKSTVTGYRTAYITDQSKLPDSLEIFKALLEINGLFLKQNRETGKYNLYSPVEAVTPLYCDDDVLCAEDLYVRDTNTVPLNPSQYRSLWYDDYEVGAYTEVSATYQSADDDTKKNATSYVHRYQQSYTEELAESYVVGESSVNLINPADFVFGTICDNGTDGEAANRIKHRNGLLVGPGRTLRMYTAGIVFSEIYEYDSDMNFLQYTSHWNESGEFFITTTNDTQYVRMIYRKSGNGGILYIDEFLQYAEAFLGFVGSEIGDIWLTFDLSENNPFSNGDTVYLDAGQWEIRDAWVAKDGSVPLFDFPVDYSPYVEVTSDQWSQAKEINVKIRVLEEASGEVRAGKRTEEEIAYERKNLDLSENRIIADYKISDTAMQSILDKTLERVSEISYVPAEIECVGLPYIEAGDGITIQTVDGEIIPTIVLNRMLSGIQSLKDTYESN